MSVQLLDKTRKINKLLHNSNSSKVIFNDICQVLMETLSSNILVLSKKGKVLGVSLCPGVEEITELIEDKVGGYVDALLNERFLGVLSTKENVNLQTLGFEHVSSGYQGIINPIDIAGERLGTVFMYRSEKPYDIEDIKPEQRIMMDLYPEIYSCIGCNACTKACTQDLNVMQYIAYAQRGEFEKCAEESFDCIGCGCCSVRCPAEISHPMVGVLARRLTGKYIAPESKHLTERVEEIHHGDYDQLIEQIMQKPIEEMQELYNNREIEK